VRDGRRLDVTVVGAGDVADAHRARRHSRDGKRNVQQILSVVDFGVHRNAGLLRRLAQDAAWQVGIVGGDRIEDVAQRGAAAE
jgi:hypothetical protein